MTWLMEMNPFFKEFLPSFADNQALPKEILGIAKIVLLNMLQ